MKRAQRRLRGRMAALPLAVCLLAPAAPAAGAPANAPEGGFLAENAAAMAAMHAGMDIQPTGDVDADFVAMMIAHHQGAIDMARAVLRHGRNEQVRRIAQEIVVEQQQEIAAMRLAIAAGQGAAATQPDRAGED